MKMTSQTDSNIGPATTHSQTAAHQQAPNDPPILLVDDSDDDTVLISLGLRKAQVPNPVKIVRNGLEAIQYLSGEGLFADRSQYPLPALILLDLKMPVVDGFEVLAWIQSRSEFSAIRIIILTDRYDASDLLRACGFGAYSFFVKPFNFEDLVNLVSAVVTLWIPQDEMRASVPRLSLP